jgi:hypothetical protein
MLMTAYEQNSGRNASLDSREKFRREKRAGQRAQRAETQLGAGLAPLLLMPFNGLKSLYDA